MKLFEKTKWAAALLALAVGLAGCGPVEGDMSYLSLVNTVYFARQQAMG